MSEALLTTYVRRVLVDETSVRQHQDLLNVASRSEIPLASVPSRVFADLADTVTPQGILALCDCVDVPLAEALSDGARLVVLCDQVRDPGNLGTVIRCADAFGADAVLVSGDSVDLYNPKTVRASTGSVFHLPICTGIDLAEAVALGRQNGLATYGADGGADCTIDDLAASGELAKPILWVFGNEAWGLTDDHIALLDRLVALPMYGRAESLNLSTAAAVILYATATSQHC